MTENSISFHIIMKRRSVNESLRLTRSLSSTKLLQNLSQGGRAFLPCVAPRQHGTQFWVWFRTASLDRNHSSSTRIFVRAILRGTPTTTQNRTVGPAAVRLARAMCSQESLDTERVMKLDGPTFLQPWEYK